MYFLFEYFNNQDKDVNIVINKNAKFKLNSYIIKYIDSCILLGHYYFLQN